VSNFSHETDPKDLNTTGFTGAVENRLSQYYRFMKEWEEIGYKTVTPEEIGEGVQVDSQQVLEDLESIGILTQPRIGYVICNILYELELSFGWNKLNEGILVGVGNIGSALLGYDRFEQCGLKILVAFDTDPAKVGTSIHGKEVRPMDELASFVREHQVPVALLTVPAPEAQPVADLLVGAGIRAIWNFAPVHLEVPETVLVQHSDLYRPLAALSKRLAEKLA
jgi:redox-sensing transcriptional repressor